MGCSSSFSLVQQYGGVVVPYRDVRAAAEAIRATPVESLEIKVARGNSYARAHSWTAKIARILKAYPAPQEVPCASSGS